MRKWKIQKIFSGQPVKFIKPETVQNSQTTHVPLFYFEVNLPLIFHLESIHNNYLKNSQCIFKFASVFPRTLQFSCTKDFSDNIDFCFIENAPKYF